MRAPSGRARWAPARSPAPPGRDPNPSKARDGFPQALHFRPIELVRAHVHESQHAIPSHHEGRRPGDVERLEVEADVDPPPPGDGAILVRHYGKRRGVSRKPRFQGRSFLAVNRHDLGTDLDEPRMPFAQLRDALRAVRSPRAAKELQQQGLGSEVGKVDGAAVRRDSARRGGGPSGFEETRTCHEVTSPDTRP